jgi:general secretion pathway protein G
MFESNKEVVMRKTAFTLIELMLVVIIIGILVAMVTPKLTGRSEEARTKVAKADVESSIATALKLFELDNGRFPATSEGLAALRDKPSWAKNWKGPYLDKKPLDPWEREYQYRFPGKTRAYDYDLFSFGPDGVESADDITNADEK